MIAKKNVKIILDLFYNYGYIKAMINYGLIKPKQAIDILKSYKVCKMDKNQLYNCEPEKIITSMIMAIKYDNLGD